MATVAQQRELLALANLRPFLPNGPGNPQEIADLESMVEIWADLQNAMPESIDYDSTLAKIDALKAKYRN